jgi:tetratricopeptide (TPR) repeat protein
MHLRFRMARTRKRSSTNDPLEPLRKLFLAGRTEEAADEYAKRLGEPRPLALDAAGVPICLAAERWEAARIGAERLIAEGARGDRAKHHAAHARALLGLGRVEEAHAALVRARDLDPSDPSMYELEAIVLRAKGDLPGALYAAEGAIALDAHRPAAYGLIAELLELLGRGDEAVERLREAVRKLARDPQGHARILGQLATLLEGRGEHEEASAARGLAAQLVPKR